MNVNQILNITNLLLRFLNKRRLYSVLIRFYFDWQIQLFIFIKAYGCLIEWFAN
jgi:hypothetical protein